MSGIINRARSKSGHIGPSAGLEFIEEKIWVTADSDNLKIIDCFSDEFKSYFLQIYVTPSTNTHDIKLRWVRDSNTIDESSSYQYLFHGWDWDGASYTFSGKNATLSYIVPNCHNSTSWGCQASLWVHGARDNARNMYTHGEVTWLHGSDKMVGGHWSQAWNGADSQLWEGLIVFCSSTLRAGSYITVYGVRT